MPIQVDQYWRLVQGLLLPPVCVLCADRGQSPDVDLCAGCERELPRIERPCVHCALPLAGADALGICGACLSRGPLFDRAFSACRYAYPVNHLVQRLKYQRRLSCARVLGTLVARGLAASRREPWPEALLPVPLSRARFVARGCNQALEIGRCVERLVGVPMRSDLLERLRDTREQVELEAVERRRNVRGAFGLRFSLPYAHVAIIDDVITTGSTAREIARTLKRAGVDRVEVWSAARTVGPAAQ